jgi:hypothetical protein
LPIGTESGAIRSDFQARSSSAKRTILASFGATLVRSCVDRERLTTNNEIVEFKFAVVKHVPARHSGARSRSARHGSLSRPPGRAIPPWCLKFCIDLKLSQARCARG